jgi:hypothetical protein
MQGVLELAESLVPAATYDGIKITMSQPSTWEQIFNIGHQLSKLIIDEIITFHKGTTSIEFSKKIQAVYGALGSSSNTQLRMDVITGAKRPDMVAKMDKSDFESVKVKQLRAKVEQKYINENIIVRNQQVYTIKTHKGEHECIIESSKLVKGFMLV